MSPSLEFLERCSAETGFAVATLEKVVRLGELAADIGRHPLLGKVLALKGGTALNLGFGPPARLSVDMDFNYIGREGREEMLGQRPSVRGAVLELVQRLQYHIQESPEGFSGGKIYLSYRSVAGTFDRIELDLNFLFRVPFSGIIPARLWQPGGLEQPTVQIVGLPELVVGKLLAFLDRSAVRDLWDAANLPPAAMELLASASFRRLLISFSAILPHPTTTYTKDRLEKMITERAIADHLRPTLARDSGVSKQDLIERGWSVIEPFLRLTAGERQYLSGIERGALLTALIFPDDPEAASRIADHPALQWKIKNVRASLSRPS
jgi:predicted nucleotidyltransferase component of viral defense system